MATTKPAAKIETQVETTVAPTTEVVDVTNLQEVAGPTFEQQIAKLDTQIDDQATYPMVREALIRARSQIVKAEMRSLMAQIRVVRAMLPPRAARVARKPKVAKA